MRAAIYRQEDGRREAHAQPAKKTPARSSSRLIVAARVSVTPWVLPEARLRSRPPGRALRPWRALRRTVPTVTVISPVSCGERAVWNQILKYHHLDHDIATDTTLAIRIATIRSARALARRASRVPYRHMHISTRSSRSRSPAIISGHRCISHIRSHPPAISPLPRCWGGSAPAKAHMIGTHALIHSIGACVMHAQCAMQAQPFGRY